MSCPGLRFSDSDYQKYMWHLTIAEISLLSELFLSLFLLPLDLFKSRFLISFFRPFKQRDVSVKCYPIHMYLNILYFRETYFSRFSRFSRFKKFREIKVPPKKGAAKIKDGKFSDLYENLYLSFPSATSSVLGGGLKFQFSACPYSSLSDSSC